MVYQSGVGDCSVTEHGRRHLPYQTSKTVHVRGDQIFFSATCPGQVASKNPLVLRNFLLVPNISVIAYLSVRLQIPLFLIQNAIQIKQL